MGSVPVVAMQPLRQRPGALFGALVGTGVGPFAQCGLDEALGLAVRLRCIGSGAYMSDCEAAAGFGEGSGLVAGSIVRHHPLNRDTKALVIGDSSLKESDGALLSFIG